ncbi:MAG: putative Ig domain-containing protein [Candidatus Polarisedimenticolaceae bacterium]|nr:putative Ig domain-containing protein [Candidatus Polarisedimenticolaceae bacterium]
MMNNFEIATRLLCALALSVALTACGGGAFDPSATVTDDGTNVTDDGTNVTDDGTNVTDDGTDAPNNPPTIFGTPILAVDAGMYYSFAPTAYDSDNDVLTFNIINAPAWASFDTSTGVLSGTPEAADVGIDNSIVISVFDGTAIVSLIQFDIVVNAITGTADLSWMAPPSREDSTPLSFGEIAGYRIYHGATPENMVLLVDIPDPSTLEYTVSAISMGTHYFASTTYDIFGGESRLSNIVVKNI